MTKEELRQYLIDEIDLQKEFLNQHEVGFIREDEEERLSALETALNLIDKQQKEIEQLANGIRVLGTNPDITTEEIIKEFTEKPITEEYMKEFNSSYISKDKVLKALGYNENDEEYKRIYNKEELILSLIRTINAECDRLEDIEDQKTMLEIHNIENQRDKYWQDKIRDKIKELEEYQKQHKEGNWTDIPIEDYDFDKINLLKELLEE